MGPLERGTAWLIWSTSGCRQTSSRPTVKTSSSPRPGSGPGHVRGGGRHLQLPPPAPEPLRRHAPRPHTRWTPEPARRHPSRQRLALPRTPGRTAHGPRHLRQATHCRGHPTLHSRTATVRQLVLQAPPSVIAGMLGYHAVHTEAVAALRGSFHRVWSPVAYFFQVPPAWNLTGGDSSPMAAKRSRARFRRHGPCAGRTRPRRPRGVLRWRGQEARRSASTGCSG